MGTYMGGTRPSLLPQRWPESSDVSGTAFCAFCIATAGDVPGMEWHQLGAGRGFDLRLQQRHSPFVYHTFGHSHCVSVCQLLCQLCHVFSCIISTYFNSWATWKALHPIQGRVMHSQSGCNVPVNRMLGAAMARPFSLCHAGLGKRLELVIFNSCHLASYQAETGNKIGQEMSREFLFKRFSKLELLCTD